MVLSGAGLLVGTLAALYLFGVKLALIVFVVLLVLAAIIVMLAFLLSARGAHRG